MNNVGRLKLFLLALFAVGLPAFMGCGIYSFSGSIAPHLKTVAVPLFVNRTAEFGMAEELTDSIIHEFTRDNTLKIADPSEADVLVEGVIVRIDDRAGAFDRQEQVQDLKIYISVQIKCTDQVKRQKLWEERLTHYGSYDPATGAEGRLEAVNEALTKISQDILNKTVAGW